MNQKLLEGEIVSEGQGELARLRAAVERLTQERDLLREENAELQQASSSMAAPIAHFREKMEPFYRLLQAIFGDLEKIGDASPAPTAAPQYAQVDAHTPIWNSWKQKLGGQCAKIIDVLLTHREMNTTQLAIAIGTNRNNIPNLIYKLNQAGLINKNGGRFSLKQL